MSNNYPQPPAAGYPQAPASNPYGVSDVPTGPLKSFTVTWILALLLGGLGIDRFYLGKIGTGIAKLLTGGGFGVWSLVDLIITLTGKRTDVHGRPLDGYEKNKLMAILVTVGLFVLESVLAVVLVISGLAGLAAVGTAVGNTDKPAIESPTDSGVSGEKTKVDPSKDGSVPLGTTAIYEDGIKLTVITGGFLPISEFANVPGDKAAAFQITVENTSDTEFDAALMSFPKVTYGASNTEAKQVFDDTFTFQSFSTILPGEKQIIQAAYDIPAAEADNVRVEMRGTTYGGQKAIFKGAIK